VLLQLGGQSYLVVVVVRRYAVPQTAKVLHAIIISTAAKEDDESPSTVQEMGKFLGGRDGSMKKMTRQCSRDQWRRYSKGMSTKREHET
jgi:hypothetical protein